VRGELGRASPPSEGYGAGKAWVRAGPAEKEIEGLVAAGIGTSAAFPAVPSKCHRLERPRGIKGGASADSCSRRLLRLAEALRSADEHPEQGLHCRAVAHGTERIPRYPAAF